MKAKARNQSKHTLKEDVVKKSDLATRTQMTTTLDSAVLLKAKQTAKEHNIPLSRIIDAALIDFINSLEQDTESAS